MVDIHTAKDIEVSIPWNESPLSEHTERVTIGANTYDITIEMNPIKEFLRPLKEGWEILYGVTCFH